MLRTIVSIAALAAAASAAGASEPAAPPAAPPAAVEQPAAKEGKEPAKKAPAKKEEAPSPSSSKTAPAPVAPAPKPEESARRPGMDDSFSDFFLASATKGELRLPIRNQLIPKGMTRRFGEWDGRFFFAETATWDNNIFSAEKNMEDDVVFLSTLGGAFAREGSDFAAEIAGAATWEAYVDHPNENVIDAFGRAGLQYGMRRAFVRVGDQFTRTQDSQQSVTTPGGGTFILTGQDMTIQNENVLVMASGYRWEKLEAELRYNNINTNYTTGAMQEMDRTEHTGTAIVRHHLTPKMDVNGQAEYSETNYDEAVNNDFSTIGFYVGAKWTPTPKTEVEGRLGWMDMNSYDTGVTADDDEYRGFAGDGMARWAVSPKLRVSAFSSYDVHAVAGANSQTVLNFGADVGWEVTPVWIANVRGYYQHSDPSTGEGAQSYYNAVGRLGWRGSERWELALQYEFRALSSRSAFSDFAQHRVSLQASFLF